MMSFIFWMMVLIPNTYAQEATCGAIFNARMITLATVIPLEYVGMNETSCFCRELPAKFSACFSNTDLKKLCTKFPKNVKLNTPALLLESTNMEKLEVGDLAIFTHLEVMAMKGNQKFSHIEPNVFDNMTNLISLTFIFNPLLSHIDRYAFKGLKNLKELNLMRNGFHRIGDLVESLTPNILPSLCRLNLKENALINISEFDFELMNGTFLKELDITSCRLENIHSRSLKPLKYLEVLRIGNNNMNLEILLMLLNDIFTMGIDISLLDLYSSGFRNNLPIPLLEVVSKSNIRSLVLSRNQFDFIGNNTFPIIMPRLTSIDLSDVSLQMLHEEAFSHIPHLETLLLGKNRLSFFASSKHLSSLTHIDLHENSDAYGSEFILAKSKFHRMSLENLELQHTPLIFLRKPDFANMTQLKNLNLDNCSIVRMDDYVFQDLTSLKYLNLENNKIFYVCKRIPLHIWKGLENLEKLLLGGNGIFQLSAHSLYLFDYLENLRYLGLQRNSLTSISSKDFRYLPKLKVLDLSYNHIVSWDDRVFLNNALKEFRASANKLTYFSEAMLQDFYNLTNIDMNFNSFICDCRVMNKMSKNKKSLTNLLNLVKDQNLLCEKTSNKTLNNFLKNVTNSEINCEKKVSSLVYIIPLSVIFVIAAVLAILSYRYRWHIRYWAFLVKLYLIRKGKAKNAGRRSTNNFQFDAFVSYCSQDRSFVLNLVQMLENHEPYLKLSVYERDFQVGSVISESIRDHIEKSRKTLLIVSNSYAKSHWCTWETQIAEHHRLFSEKPNGEIVDESIVLIKLGIVEGSNLTPTLKYLLKTRIYLQWEDQDDERKVFWQKLRQFLSPPEKQISQESLNKPKDSNLSISQ